MTNSMDQALRNAVIHIDRALAFWVNLYQEAGHINDPLINLVFSASSQRTFMELHAVKARLAYVLSLKEIPDVLAATEGPKVAAVEKQGKPAKKVDPPAEAA